MIFILHQYGVHWWINKGVKLKNDPYSLNESYILVTLDSMNGRNINNILQVKNILKYFVDTKHIEVQHVTLKNIQKQNDSYFCGVCIFLYSYCGLLMINEDLSKEVLCKQNCSYSATYGIHIFRRVIHVFF